MKDTMSQVSPLPWSARVVEPKGTGTALILVESHKETLFEAMTADAYGMANARFIVTACNGWQSLVESLRELVALHDDQVSICGKDDENKVALCLKKARNALAKSTPTQEKE